MTRALIICPRREEASELISLLAECGLACTVVPSLEAADQELGERGADLVLVAESDSSPMSKTGDWARRIKQRQDLPIVAFVPGGAVLDSSLAIDDYVFAPWDHNEVAFRVGRILRKTSGSDEGEVIKSGDLVIDEARCEVSVQGVVVPLTFKEYELLRLLASHEGKVFTRQAILTRIWGDHYYGSDRTLNVHIRRLRSKIESQRNSFIQTVRHVGYKFKSGVSGPVAT